MLDYKRGGGGHKSQDVDIVLREAECLIMMLD